MSSLGKNLETGWHKILPVTIGLTWNPFFSNFIFNRSMSCLLFAIIGKPGGDAVYIFEGIAPSFSPTIAPSVEPSAAPSMPTIGPSNVPTSLASTYPTISSHYLQPLIF